MIVVADPDLILIFQNWKCVKKYKDTIPLNNYLSTAHCSTTPGFDMETFPFLMCAGSHGISIINIAGDYIDSLI